MATAGRSIPIAIRWEVIESKGGKMSSDNLVLACRYCNRSKGDRDSDG